MPLHVSSTRAHRQEVKIVLYSLWYHHTETSEWSKITKITKIQFYKYEHHVLIVRRPELYYTVSGIITLKQVSGLKLLKLLKLLKYNSISMNT